MDASGVSGRGEAGKHWSQMIQETLLSVRVEGALGITVLGGAENGQFCWVDIVDASNVVFYSGRLHHDEIILEIQGQKVAGYTLHDLQEWLLLTTNNNNPVLVKTVLTGCLPKDLREFLNTRFQKGSIDHDLQQSVRNNIYKRTVPCTTRHPRPGEVDGVDYKFLTLEEFSALEKNGVLLESGVFDGNFYGTPKPPKIPSSSDSPFRRTSSVGNIVPGQHPSSEGKRRRNRSNIETNLARNALGEAHRAAQLERKKSLERVHTRAGHQTPLPSNWDEGNATDLRYASNCGSESVQWIHSGLNRADLAKDNSTADEIAALTRSLDELPYGWERINDPVYGTYYIDHNNKKTQYEHPRTQLQPQRNRDGVLDDQPDSPSSGLFSDKSSDRGHRKGADSWANGNRSPPVYAAQRYTFTRNPAELRGDFVTTCLVKSKKGLGFTIIGGDDSNEEFLQIKNIIALGPAHEDGKLKRSDILVYINDQCVLGYSHQDIIALFQSIPIGDSVSLEVCRGYPLPFDPDDPNNEIITTVAVTLPSSSGISPAYAEHRSSKIDWMKDGRSSSRGQFAMSRAKSLDDNSDDLTLTYSSPSSINSQPELLKVAITRGPSGFGFTIADSVHGQKVKQILDRPRCKILQEGDVLVEINGVVVKDLKHSEVVQVLKNCPLGTEAVMTVQRGGIPSHSRVRKPNSRSHIIGLDIRDGQNEDGTAFLRSSLPDSSKHGSVKLGNEVEAKPCLVNSKEDVGQSDPLTRLPRNDGAGDDRQSPEEDGQYRNAAIPPMHSAESLDLPDQRHSVYTGDDNLNQPLSKLDRIVNYGVNSRLPSYDYAGYGAARRNYFIDFDSRAAAGRYDAPSLRDSVAQLSFSEYDKRATPVARIHSRSKTPGPDMMRQQAVHDGDPYRQGQELRSKTPTQDASSSRMAKPISGTPDFVPASRYKAPSPSARLQAGDPTGNRRGDRNSMSSSVYRELSPVNNRRAVTTPMPGGSSAHMYVGQPNSGVSNSRPVTPSLKQLNQQMAEKSSTSFENVEPVSSGGSNPKDGWADSPSGSTDSRSPLRSQLDGQDYDLIVHLIRQELGFGFRIVGGTEEGSQVSVGHIVPGGAADSDGRLRPGDEITYIDSICVIGASHHKVVQLMGQSSSIGHVTLRVRRRSQFGTDLPGLRSGQLYDVTLTRRDGEGFGFVIISSVTRSGSIIGKLVEGSPADRCGKLHVGNQILAVNHVTIAHMLHEQIVSLIKDSGHTVTLTIGGPDDTSSLSSVTQRSASVPPASLGFQTQSESDMSRHSEYSPYHNPRIPPYSLESVTRDLSYLSMPPFNSRTSAPDLNQSDKFYLIELQRSSRGFGFSIRGGKEFNNMPLFILKIAEGGAAHADGQLKVGDQIIEINGHNTNNMTHVNAIDLIQSCNTSIRLLVKRSGKPVPGLSTSQLPGSFSYLHNGITPQDLPRASDTRIPLGKPERVYNYGQNVSQQYPASYR